MGFAWKSTLAGAAISLLAACGTIDGDLVSDMENRGDAFHGALRDGYVVLGRNEAAEYDWIDSDYFYEKGIASADGNLVLPDTMESRDIPEAHVAELSAARQRLLTALDSSARQKVPSAAAKAQVMFDCWMQEQEENHQPDDIAACKAGFEAAMAEVDAAMRPMVAAPPPPAAPVAAPAPPTIVDGLYLVFFDFDDDRPNTESGAVILKILDDYNIDNPARVNLTGHTDRAGSDAYNMGLSQRRADSIRALLIEAGVPADRIVVNFVGESQPLRPTDDGVREARNRRVEVEFE
jgi:OOP family OmpA-OmpF porin